MGITVNPPLIPGVTIPDTEGKIATRTFFVGVGLDDADAVQPVKNTSYNVSLQVVDPSGQIPPSALITKTIKTKNRLPKVTNLVSSIVNLEDYLPDGIIVNNDTDGVLQGLNCFDTIRYNNTLIIGANSTGTIKIASIDLDTGIKTDFDAVSGIRNDGTANLIDVNNKGIKFILYNDILIVVCKLSISSLNLTTNTWTNYDAGTGISGTIASLLLNNSSNHITDADIYNDKLIIGMYGGKLSSYDITNNVWTLFNATSGIRHDGSNFLGSYPREVSIAVVKNSPSVADSVFVVSLEEGSRHKLYRLSDMVVLKEFTSYYGYFSSTYYHTNYITPGFTKYDSISNSIFVLLNNGEIDKYLLNDGINCYWFRALTGNQYVYYSTDMERNGRAINGFSFHEGVLYAFVTGALIAAKDLSTGNMVQNRYTINDLKESMMPYYVTGSNVYYKGIFYNSNLFLFDKLCTMGCNIDNIWFPSDRVYIGVKTIKLNWDACLESNIEYAVSVKSHTNNGSLTVKTATNEFVYMEETSNGVYVYAVSVYDKNMNSDTRRNNSHFNMDCMVFNSTFDENTLVYPALNSQDLEVKNIVETDNNYMTAFLWQSADIVFKNAVTIDNFYPIIILKEDIGNIEHFIIYDEDGYFMENGSVGNGEKAPNDLLYSVSTLPPYKRIKFKIYLYSYDYSKKMAPPAIVDIKTLLPTNRGYVAKHEIGYRDPTL